MTGAEGIIRYRLEFTRRPLPKAWRALFPAVNAHRRLAFHLKVIGQDEGRYGGLAYGNLSVRFQGGFIVTATQTGGQERLRPEDYCLVESVDLDHFTVWASGLRPPSSEAVTHAAVYAFAPGVRAVLHGHHPLIWQYGQELGFGTVPGWIGHGTPEMARRIAQIVREHPRSGGVVMLGHRDGFLLYAPSLGRLSDLLKKAFLAIWRLEDRHLPELE